ncbi:MAG: hypothetical protein ABSH44_05975 [Bryobacteraceae bacterium]
MQDSADPRAAQIRKILESGTFRSTEVLKRLLDYLGGQALADQAGDLKEYTVGVEAFRKPPDYDPQTDSSVRVQTGKLRQKLEEYYRTDGLEDSLVIELPKGHFKLAFHPRHPQGRTTLPRRWTMWAGGAVLVALIAAGLYLQLRVRPGAAPSASGRWNSEMEELWKPFLASQRPIMVAIGAPLFTKIGNSFFRDPTLNTWEAAAQSERLRAVEHALGDSPASPVFTYTGVGEASGAFALERLLLPRGKDLSLQASNLLTWEDIARYNMIFLGPPKYNLQTLDLPVQQDFEIGHARVQNLHPMSGEPSSYEEKWTADRSRLEEGSALISRLPGLHRTGEMLILAGSSTECTRAAVEYVTRAEYVTPFVRWMREKQGDIPAWYQVVIRARFKTQTPIAIERVAFHALK